MISMITQNANQVSQNNFVKRLPKVSLIEKENKDLILFIEDSLYGKDIEIQTFGIWSRKEQAKIGEVELRFGNFDEIWYGNLGYMIFPPYRNKGYVVEACLILKEYLLESSEIRKLFITIDETNIISQKVITHLGEMEKAGSVSYKGERRIIYLWTIT